MGRLSALVILLLFTLTSCAGYRFGYDPIACQYHTFALPFVEGDEYGELTSALVDQVSTRTGLRFQSCNADLVLCVRIVETREKNVGFRYDTEEIVVDTRNIIPAETRLELFVEVSLIDPTSEEIVMGPQIISGRLDYDHDYYSNLGGVNLFSLGQLNDIDIAQEAARRPAFREVAKNVADYIANGWFKNTKSNEVCDSDL